MLGGDHGVKFEHECYDVGHLYNLAYCLDAKWFQPPVFVQWCLEFSAASAPTCAISSS